MRNVRLELWSYLRPVESFNLGKAGKRKQFEELKSFKLKLI